MGARARPWGGAFIVAAALFDCSSGPVERSAPPAWNGPEPSVPSSPWARALSAAVDGMVVSAPHGEPFVIGELGKIDAAGRVPLVAAYDVHGALRWTLFGAGSASAPRPSYAVPLADGGLALIGMLTAGTSTLGEVTVDAGEHDGFFARVASDGTVSSFMVILRAGKGSLSTISALAAADDGGWLVGGQLYGAADFGAGGWTSPAAHPEAVLVHYDARGAPIWSHRWRDTGLQGLADVDGVTIDALGHVVVTGIVAGTIDLGEGPVGDPALERNVFLAGLRADGAPLWSRAFGTPSSAPSLALTQPAALADGRVVVGGTFDGGIDWGAGRRERARGKVSGFVAAYDAGGHLVGGGETAFVPVSLVDDGGAISVAGFDPSDGRTLRAAVAHVTLDGTVLDLRRIGQGSVRSIAPGPGDDVYVSGAFRGTLTVIGAPPLVSAAPEEGFVARMFP